MALVPSTRYPAQTDAAIAYPHGKARNAVTFQDGTGTPLERDWVNDIWGFLQALLARATITPTGAPDEVGASQYLSAIDAIVAAAIAPLAAATSKAVERALLATWSDGGLSLGFEFNAMCWASAYNRFLVGHNFGDVYSSPDGQLWTLTGAGAGSFNGLAANAAGTAVGVGGSGSVRSSLDGAAWTTRTSGTANELRGITWTGTQFVAVGAAGTVITSATGTTWIVRTPVTANQLEAVATNGSIIVAVGASGRIITSPTGITWTVRTSGTTDTLMSVAWSAVAGLFVAVGDLGRILTSPDGITWTPRTSGVSNFLFGVTATDNYIIAAGLAGSLLFSVTGLTWQKISHPSDAGAFDARTLAWSGLTCVACSITPGHGRISHSLARLP